MNTHSSKRAVALWLLICCGMVFAMALLGAVTRLTESGLSITEWKPVTGVLPPMNDAEWAQAFADYQKIPQYQLLHSGMTIEEFRNIYFWEWLHRLWGRMTGLAFALPLLYFLARKTIDKKLTLKLAGLFALGGLQGFIGWFMVESGLEIRTSVSPYRLALHLGFALLIYALMLWLALDLRGGRRTTAPRGLVRHGWLALALLAVTMTWGAFVAGLHAGSIYNSWPLMDGDFFPSAALTLTPKWVNVFENGAFAQFIHRWLAPAAAAAILLWVWRLARFHKHEDERRWAMALGAMALFQVSLGLDTLLTHAEVMIATLHQAGAVTLLTLLLVNLQKLKLR